MKYHMDTIMTPEEFEKSFAAAVFPTGPKTYYNLQYHQQDLFIGHYKNGRFWFEYKPRFVNHNSYAMILKGRIQAAEDGNIIHYCLTKSRVVKVFVTIWSAPLILFGLLILLAEGTLWGYVPLVMAAAGITPMIYRPAKSVERLVLKLHQINSIGPRREQ